MKFISVILFIVSIGYSQTYVRSEWGVSWVDVDKDCQNTRQEVLIEESLIPVTFDESGCKVTSGLWVCIYTGQVFTDPSKLDIDHFVPLENAFVSGGYAWTSSKKKEYANFLGDKYHLVAVSSSANRAKQGSSPDKWMPSYKPTQCAYLKIWSDIKDAWELTYTDAESIFIDHFSNINCN